MSFPLDALNPKILLINHIGKGNMPTDTPTFGSRATRWHELDIITWGHGVDHVLGKSYPVTSGDIFYRTPGLINRHDLPYHCYFFVFDPYYDESHEPQYALDPINQEHPSVEKAWDPIPLFSSAQQPYLGKAKDMELIIVLCQKLMMEYSSPHPDPLLLKILFLQLLREVASQVEINNSDKEITSTHGQYRQIILEHQKWMQENPTASFDMEEAAGRINVSYSFFSRLFKSITGEKYSAYAVKVKLNHVKLQLLDTNKTVAEIAADCGFSDPNYLYTLFKKRVGCTPTEYRLLMASGLYDSH